MKICSTLLMIIIEVLFTPTFTTRSLRITAIGLAATAALTTTLAATTPATAIPSKHLTENSVKVHHVEGNTQIIGHTIKTPPIVIHTQQRNYEEPTLKEYEECHVKLKKCQDLCNIHSNRTACELDKCPICPILIDNNIQIQGVNDTHDSATHHNRNRNRNHNHNTTNIIRLTNDIHNHIDNRLGNVTHNNLNNVNIQHNISRVMSNGKYGLGIDKDGQSCCLLLHDRQCNDDHKGKNYHQYHRHHDHHHEYHHEHDHDHNREQHHQHSHHHRHQQDHQQQHQRNSNGCRYRSQRVCGKKCTARIIQMKRVKICEQNIDEMNEIDYIENNNCHIAVRYTPYHPGHYKRSYAHHTTTKCHYQPYWPYVQCNRRHNVRNSWHNMCGYCYRYPYGHLLQYGLPQHCHRCFNHYSYATYYNNFVVPSFILPWSNFDGPIVNDDFNINDFNYYGLDDGHNDNDYMDTIIENWKINKTTCKLEDGSLSDECIELIWNDNENHHLTTESPAMLETRHINNSNDDNDNNDDNDTNDEDNNDGVSNENNNNNNMDDYIDISDNEDDDVRSDKRALHYLFKRSKYSHRYKN